MKRFLERIDPYHQSFLYFKWGFWSILIMAVLCWWMTAHWKGWLMSALMDNIFVYLPNYLMHEMAGHNFIGKFSWFVLYHINETWARSDLGTALTLILAGNGVETLVPLLCYLGALRLAGGRYLLPPILYWLGTTFYGMGLYMSDARACSLPLTSADMITNYAAGEICGDWHNIFGPMGLLEWDTTIGIISIAIGMLCFILAVRSIYEYWVHYEDYFARF